MTEMTFGETLKMYREQQGLSQQKLANLAGVNRSHIGSIESTKPGTIEEPEYDTIVRLAKGLGLTPAALLAPTGRTVMEAAGVYLMNSGKSRQMQKLVPPTPCITMRYGV